MHKGHYDRYICIGFHGNKIERYAADVIRHTAEGERGPQSGKLVTSKIPPI